MTDEGIMESESWADAVDADDLRQPKDNQAQETTNDVQAQPPEPPSQQVESSNRAELCRWLNKLMSNGFEPRIIFPRDSLWRQVIYLESRPQRLFPFKTVLDGSNYPSQPERVLYAAGILQTQSRVGAYLGCSFGDLKPFGRPSYSRERIIRICA